MCTMPMKKEYYESGAIQIAWPIRCDQCIREFCKSLQTKKLTVFLHFLTCFPQFLDASQKFATSYISNAFWKLLQNACQHVVATCFSTCCHPCATWCRLHCLSLPSGLCSGRKSSRHSELGSSQPLPRTWRLTKVRFTKDLLPKVLHVGMCQYMSANVILDHYTYPTKIYNIIQYLYLPWHTMTIQKNTSTVPKRLLKWNKVDMASRNSSREAFQKSDLRTSAKPFRYVGASLLANWQRTQPRQSQAAAFWVGDLQSFKADCQIVSDHLNISELDLRNFDLHLCDALLCTFAPRASWASVGHWICFSNSSEGTTKVSNDRKQRCEQLCWRPLADVALGTASQHRGQFPSLARGTPHEQPWQPCKAAKLRSKQFLPVIELSLYSLYISIIQSSIWSMWDFICPNLNSNVFQFHAGLSCLDTFSILLLSGRPVPRMAFELCDLRFCLDKLNKRQSKLPMFCLFNSLFANLKIDIIHAHYAGCIVLDFYCDSPAALWARYVKRCAKLCSYAKLNRALNISLNQALNRAPNNKAPDKKAPRCSQ